MNIDWRKAPEWAVAYAQVIYEHATTAKDFAWVCADGYNVNPFGSDKPVCHPYTKGIFTADQFRLIEFRPAKGQPWTGEGLPPRGQKCEVQPWSEHDAPWTEVEFIASWLAPNGQTYSWVHTGYGWLEPKMFRFRPIRTPEQIAAEKREANAKELYERTFGHPASSRWEGLTQERKNDFLSAIDEGWQKVGS